MKFKQQKLIALGDIHGDLTAFDPILRNPDMTKDSVIVQVGDFCANGRVPTLPHGLMELNAGLAKLNSTLVVVRGNWDHPSLFDGSADLGNIRFVSDGTLVDLPAGTLLCVGGATAHRGASRRESRCIVPTKPPCSEVSMLVTHTFPRRMMPPERRCYFQPAVGNVIAVLEEDERLAAFAQSLRGLQGWLFGHYHEDMSFQLEWSAGAAAALGIGFKGAVALTPP